VTTNKNLNTPANGSNVSTWDVPVNANFTTIDTAFGGNTLINVTGASGTTVLTSTQYIPPIILFSGTLSGNLVYQIPSGIGGIWAVYNNTSGAYTLTISSGGSGTSVVITQGARQQIGSDGTNIFVTTSAVSNTNVAQTWTALQQFTKNDLAFLGTSTGYTIVNSGLTGSSNNTLTLPTTTSDTLAALNTAQTWGATQTLNGTSATFASTLLNATETANIVASSPGSPQNFYVASGAVQYYTANAANNWVLNIAFNSGTTLNSALAVGQVATVALLVTQGSTAYYNTAVQIDGTTSGVTTYWQGGTAPTAGNASGIDVYTYTVIKVSSSPTYTVLATLTQF
jgi:hypothetical protein